MINHLPPTVINARRHRHVDVGVVVVIAGTAAVGTGWTHVHVVLHRVRRGASLPVALVER